MKNKRGNVLIENVIFIILNLIFLCLLEVFIIKQTNSSSLLEQSYAKNIALLIDSAIPVTEIVLDMDDAFKLADKNNVLREDIVRIAGNSVEIKLSSKEGYKYSFFKNVDVTAYPDIFPENKYIIKINGYNNEFN